MTYMGSSVLIFVLALDLLVGLEALQLHPPVAAEKQLGDLGTTPQISGQIATIRQIQHCPAVDSEANVDAAAVPLAVVVAYGNALQLAAGRHATHTSLTR